MNTTEKRKLEEVFSRKVRDTREEFKRRRDREHEALVQKAEKSVPKTVQAIAGKLEVLIKSTEAQKTALEKEAEKLGYDLDEAYNGDVRVSLRREGAWIGKNNNTYVQVYVEPNLTSHSQETAERLQSFDALIDKYIVTIYAETEDMQKTLERFNGELAELTK